MAGITSVTVPLAVVGCGCHGTAQPRNSSARARGSPSDRSVSNTSRSVRRPTTRPSCVTGRLPTRRSNMSNAARSNSASGPIVTAEHVMMSRTQGGPNRRASHGRRRASIGRNAHVEDLIREHPEHLSLIRDEDIPDLAGPHDLRGRLPRGVGQDRDECPPHDVAHHHRPRSLPSPIGCGPAGDRTSRPIRLRRGTRATGDGRAPAPAIMPPRGSLVVGRLEVVGPRREERSHR